MKVGVIGGGVAGLSCAARLQELGVAVTLYDTGKRGPGGRCSSRLWRGRPADHAAQFAEARTPAFAEFLASLEASGAARRLESLATLTAAGAAATVVSDGVPRYVGVGGMGKITDALAASVDDVRQDVWVSPNGGIKRNAGHGAWLVREGKGVDQSLVGALPFERRHGVRCIAEQRHAATDRAARQLVSRYAEQIDALKAGLVRQIAQEQPRGEHP